MTVSKILSGSFKIWFLLEYFYPMDFTIYLLCKLYISIASLWARRFDTYGNNSIAIRSEVQGILDYSTELLRVHHNSITGRHNYIRILILSLDFPTCPCNARGSISCFRLCEYVALRDARNLLPDNINIFGIGHHPEVLNGSYSFEAV